ncbi:acid phosphatase [Mycena amicta]|nr:acid phosphatase [Mycena amicta]
MALLTRAVVLVALACTLSAQRIVLTNDDGWAVALVRAQESALNSAGYDVVLSCPAVDKSGTGSSTTTPTVLTTPCEFNTCPTGSPAEGFNATNPRENYVNGFPVDSARFGIQTLAPKFFNGSKPDLVVSGPNVGVSSNNLGSTVLISGTVGAATEASLEGFPAIAFSAATASQVSYTTLQSAPTSANTKAALLYSQLSVELVNQLLSTSTPFLPAGILLNVNYPAATGSCTSASAFHWVLTRVNTASSSTPADVSTCGTTRLPTESSVVAKSGCFVSVSVMQASNKGDATAANQAVVLSKLASMLSCSKGRQLLKLDNSVVFVASLLRYILEKLFAIDW